MKIFQVGYKKPKGQVAGRISYLVVFLFALFCFFPASAWAEEIAGPNQVILTWTGNPATSQTITWLTPDVNANTIQYTESEGFNGDYSAAVLKTATGRNLQCDYRFTARFGLSPDAVRLPGWQGRSMERTPVFFHFQ